MASKTTGEMRLEIPPDTRFVALLGDPVSHSLSPRMHAAAFAACELPWAYLAFRVRAQHLREAVAGLRALDFAGANLTIPHKVAALALVDEVDASARRCGAVNTLVFREGQVVGYNTDVVGVRRALEEEGLDLEGARAVVLGAGGGARAACAALGEAGAERVVVLARRLSEAEKVCGAMQQEFHHSTFVAVPLEEASVRSELRRADVLVNATPVGMHPHGESCLVASAEWLHPGLVVLDMVYSPPRTKLLRLAEQVGARAVGGLAMLVHQGAEAFQLWTGRPAPVEVMKRAVGVLPAGV